MAKQLSVRIDDELEEMLEEEKSRHEFPPNDSEIVRKALREYLQGNSNPRAAAQTAD